MRCNDTGYKGTASKAGAALAVVVLAGAGALMLTGTVSCARPAPSHSSASGGWTPYKDAALGFALDKPAGWTVRADAHTILVQNADRSEIVFAEAFSASPGESAEDHLGRLPDRASLFPQARLNGVASQPSNKDEAAGALSYQGARGPGQGRVLCSVTGGKGLLFALAASGGRFDAARPVLTRVVKSLRFFAPKISAGAKVSAATPNLHYVTWSDPREDGFHVEVPKGWKADGGAFRFGSTDVRIAYEVQSPDKGMSVAIGDPRLPSSFQAPNAMTERAGMRDGANGLLHYMPALEFNRWYLNQFGRQALDNLTIGEEHDQTVASRQQTAMLQQSVLGGTQVEVSVAITEFSGRNKLIGKQVTGIIIGATQRRTNNVGGLNVTTWFANPIVLACTDDANKARSQQTVLAIWSHLMQTYRENTAWLNRRSQEIAQATGQVMRQNAQRSQQIAQNSEAQRSASMNAYWGHVNADNERQRGFINYLGDRTDVTDGAGTSVNVQSGSKHYYHNGQTGTVLGTDSAYSPGVDWTPLTER